MRCVSLRAALAAAAGMLCTLSWASAGTVTANFVSVSPGAQPFTVNYLKPGPVADTASNIRAGIMNWTQTSHTPGGNIAGDGNGFVAYCMDLAQFVASPATFTVTTDPTIVPNPASATGSLATPWAGDVTKTKHDALLRLFAKHFDAGNPSNDFHAAFQLAVWEIIFETTVGDFSLSSGTTNATGVVAAITQANTFLSNLFLGGSYATGSFLFLTAGDHQDQIVYRPPANPGPTPEIPLPTAALAGLTLLGGLGVRRVTRG
ncbi:MAG: hypothetical protein ACK4PI_02055 [Tepidisphaerales bacterium]